MYTMCVCLLSVS